MMNLAEYRRTATRLADFCPGPRSWLEGVVLNKDGSFQRTAKFRGPDLDSAVAAELVAVAGRINNAFRRLGSGWSIFVEAQRSEAATYPDSLFPDPASALGRCRAQGRLRGSGRAFRVGLLPDLPLSAPGRGSRPRRNLAL
jgi:type IV secretory pathway VirB4 component